MIGRKNEIESLLRAVSADRTSSGFKRIVSIAGVFGVGKSTLLREFKKNILGDDLASAMCYIDEDTRSVTLTEMLARLSDSFQLVGSVTHSRSIEHFAERFESHSNSTFEKFNHSRPLTEAILVDWFSSLFDFQSQPRGLDTFQALGLTPKKVLVVVDAYEKTSDILGHWLLSEFLPLVWEKRLSDLSTFDTSSINPNYFIRDFIDCRVVIAGREPLPATDLERRWDRYREDTMSIALKEFSIHEREAFFQKEGLTSTAIPDFSESSLPFLLTLFADSSKAKGADAGLIALKAQRRIFWYKTEEQMEWIRCAAFCDSFDADILRCFLGADSQRAFNYLSASEELTCTATESGGRVSLHGIVRETICRATAIDSPDLAKESHETFATIRQVESVLTGATDIERQILLRLAYFVCFDQNALRSGFSISLDVVRETIAKYNSLFIRNETTIALRQDIRILFDRFNKKWDADRYQALVERTRLIWASRREELAKHGSALEKESRTFQNNSTSLRIRLDTLEKQKEVVFSTLDARRQELEANHNRSIVLLSTREIVLARFALVFSLIFGGASWSAPSLVGLLEPRATSLGTLIQFVFATIASVFFFTFTTYIVKTLALRKRRKELVQIKATLNGLEAECARLEMQIIEIETDESECRQRLQSIALQSQHIAKNQVKTQRALDEAFI